MKTASKILALAAFASLAGCVSKVEGVKNPDIAIPIQEVVTTNGVPVVVTRGVFTAGGGWSIYARSPSVVKESLKDLKFQVDGKGVSFGVADYNRDWSANYNTFAHNLITDFATLAEKAAAAYATCGASLATAKAQSAVQRSIASYILKGGKAADTTATCSNGLCTFSDGVVSETCPYGNCGE